VSDPGVVVFDFAVFAARYPEFATLDPGLALLYFGDATIILNNTGGSQVSDLAQRASLLNMLTAHFARIAAMTATGSNVIVGRITSASEGSVSIGVEGLQGNNPSIAWYMQTPYGAAYYNATQAYRSARWVPGRQPYLGTGPFWLRGGWW